jgi:hypothetical protein
LTVTLAVLTCVDDPELELDELEGTVPPRTWITPTIPGWIWHR